MPLPPDKAILSVAIDAKVKAMLEDYAEMFDRPLSQLARNMIYIALDQFKLLNNVGVIPALNIFKDQIERFVTNKKVKDYLLVIKDEKPVTISVVIDAEVKATIEEYADYLGLPLNIFGRNLIYVGLDQFRILNALGFGKLEKLAKAFKGFIESYQKVSSTEQKQ